MHLIVNATGEKVELLPIDFDDGELGRDLTGNLVDSAISDE